MLRAVTHNKINFVFSDGNVMNRDVTLHLLLQKISYVISTTRLEASTNDFNKLEDRSF